MSHRAVRTTALFVATLTGGACTDLVIVPRSALLICTSDEECPADFVCRVDLERCIPADVADEPPIAVVDAITLDRERISRVAGHGQVTAQLTLSRVPELLTARFDDRLDLACNAADTTAPTCILDLATIDAGVEVVDGDYDIVIVGIDAAGNRATSRARVTVDVTAPDVVASSVSTSYLPLPGNPLFFPSAVGTLADGVVQLALTESPGEQPTAEVPVDTSEGRPQVAVDEDRTSGLLLGLSLRVGDDAAMAALPDGLQPLAITLTDDVGNRRTVTLADVFDLDLTAPVAVDAATSGRVVFVREPTGSQAAGPAPHFAVAGLAGAAEASAAIYVTSSSSFSSGLLGVGAAGVDGAFALDLSAVDVPRVFLHAVDGAGNIGPVARVRDVSWRASLGGREPGRARSNPHALFASGDFDALSLVPHLQVEAGDGADLVGGDGVETTARGSFRRVGPDPTGTPRRSGPQLAWHAALGQVFAFGGRSDIFTAQNALFTLEGDVWTEVSITGALRPPARDAHMVYDPENERLVVVVDQGGDTFFFEDGAWRAFAGDLPPSRNAPAMVWDGTRRAILRFGGGDAVGVHNDVWIFDGATWSQLDVTGSAPTARTGAVMGWDAVDGVVMLAGGGVDDLWSLSGSTWTQVGDGLGIAAGGCVVQDPHSGRVIFLDGSPDIDAFDARVRTWNGTQLVERAAIADGGAKNAAAAWDLAEDRLVLLGGDRAFAFPGPAFLRRFLVLEGGAWRTPPPTPGRLGPSDGAATAFDPLTSQVIVGGGGFQIGPAGFTTATRGWLGREGVFRSDVEISGAMFADASGLLGVADGNLARLTAGGWTTIGAPSSPLPPLFAATSHDRLGGFLFGGVEGGVRAATTRTVQGTTVTVVPTTTSPPGRIFHQVAYDDRLDRVILFGGIDGSSTLLSDTWAFEGGDWRRLDDGSGAPAVIADARLVFDRDRGVTVLIAGSPAGLSIFELRDDVWVARDVLVPSPQRVVFNAAFDEARGEVFVHGGVVNGLSQDDVLLWDGSRQTRPAQLFVVDLTARDALADTIDAVELDLRAGGRGFAQREVAGAAPAADPLPGVSALVWGDAWEAVGESDADSVAPADLSLVLDDPAQLTRVLKPRVVVALTPRHRTGNGLAATLRSERFEVVVRYHEQ